MCDHYGVEAQKKNHGGNEQNRLYGATVGIVEGAFGQALDTLEKSSNTHGKTLEKLMKWKDKLIAQKREEERWKE